MKILQSTLLKIKYPFLRIHNMCHRIWTAIKCRRFSDIGYLLSHTKLDLMPAGWRKAFGEQMCEEIKQALLKNGRKSLYSYVVGDIKEKYGSLRWYDYNAPKEVYDIINKYEQLSMCYCINCGKPVRYRTDGWIEYLCEDCAKKTIKPEFLGGCRVTEEDIPHYYTFDSEGNEIELDYGVDFKKMWGLNDDVKGEKENGLCN